MFFSSTIDYEKIIKKLNESKEKDQQNIDTEKKTQQELKICKRIIKFDLVLLFVFLSLCIFLPNKEEMFLIKGIPIITNNEKLSNLTNDGLDVLQKQINLYKQLKN